jgi:hypothetical protein
MLLLNKDEGVEGYEAFYYFALLDFFYTPLSLLCFLSLQLASFGPSLKGW